ncbi:TatD family hydrolase [Candidatus Saccharibacteria bacterium]|nr:TatD family hydrolase [Candidatus Saccharibacteria bacterium]
MIDSHCHLHDPEFFTPGEQVDILQKCQKVGVEKLICIGTSHEDSLRARDFAEKHNNVYWAYGIHPSELYRTGDTHVEQAPRTCRSCYEVQRSSTREDGLEQAVRGVVTTAWQDPSKIVAIGEVGLEYHYYEDRHDEQIKLFEEMIDLALRNDLPLIFHIREAFDDFFSVIDNFHGVRGVVHSFSDNKKNLKKALERDFYIGVNGMATYSTLPLPSLERTLLETDAPFLAPVPHRGEKNNPSYIPDVARWLAEKYQTDLKTVAEVTTKNTEKLFGI